MAGHIPRSGRLGLRPILSPRWLSTQFCSLPVPFFLMDKSGDRAGSLIPRIHHPTEVLSAQLWKHRWVEQPGCPVKTCRGLGFGYGCPISYKSKEREKKGKWCRCHHAVDKQDLSLNFMKHCFHKWKNMRSKPNYFFYYIKLKDFKGLPRWPRGKESTCQCRKETKQRQLRKIPWRMKRQLTLVFLSSNPTDRGACQAAVHGVPESQTDSTHTTKDFKG